ncbi:hypothetical protein [Amycolatopsis sp. VC5-11]|uniref:hypothetical protein n=1 Tax=Amycolatopsis sp. VC5-11 TaxID=3120156 RepID=UPI0030092EFE
MILSNAALKTLGRWLVDERPAEDDPAPPMVFAYFWFPARDPDARERYSDVARWWCRAVQWPAVQQVFTDYRREPLPRRPGLAGLLDLAPVYPDAAVVTVSPDSLADHPVDAARLSTRLNFRFARLTVITTAYIASVPDGAELLSTDATEKQ